MSNQSIRIEHKGDAVWIYAGGKRIEFGWKESLEACRAFDLHLRNTLAQVMNPALAPAGEEGDSWRGVSWSFRQEQGKVLFIVNGRMVFDANTEPTEGGQPSIARQIWSEWVTATRQAELLSKNPKGQIVAEAVAFDAAILDRAGAPFGLTDDPKVKALARILAEGDQKLRRYMPLSGIKSKEVLGTPKIIRDARTAAQRFADEIERLPPTQRASMIDRLSSTGDQK